MRVRSAAPAGPRTLVLADGVQAPEAKKYLAGVTLTVLDVSPAMRIAGKHAAWRALALVGETSKDREAVAEVAYTEAFARLGVTGWVGVKPILPEGVKAGSEEDKEVPFSAEALAEAMLDQDFFEAFDALYVQPDLNRVRELDAEKNG
jgi:hypothetical protein